MNDLGTLVQHSDGVGRNDVVEAQSFPLYGIS